MKSVLQLACAPRNVRSALRVAAVVGSILNLVNHGGELLAGSAVSWFSVLLNYLVPYCVASYSSAKSEIRRRGERGVLLTQEGEGR